MKYPKSVSVFLIVAYMGLLWSCYNAKKIVPENLPKGKDAKIVRVLKKDGETIEFGDKKPAYIVGDQIRSASVSIPKAGTKIGKQGKGKGASYLFTTRDGKTYEATSYSRTSENYIIQLKAVQVVPLSEASMIWVWKINAGLTALAVVGTIAIAAGLVGAIAAISKESCPFLYSSDGSGLTMEGELYSGAIFKGIERRDFLKLHSLAGGPDGYTLKIANEADETQCTDELTLFAVDHPAGTGVFAGSDGLIHTVRSPVAPLQARDFEGRDFRRAVSAVDDDMWSSNPIGKDPENPANWRAGLVLTFPKPAEAREAKLVVRIGNTYWADAVFGRLFGLLGSKMQPWLEKTGNDMNIRDKTYKFIADQGVGLKVEIKGRDGWRDAGFFFPTGPFGIQDDLLVLPLEGAPAGDLTVRLQGGMFFWMIDYAAVDYSPDAAFKTHELSAYEARDNNGRDVKASLLRADGDYYVMPDTGCSAVVKYAAPPEEPGWERSFLVRSAGYYTLHPKEGTPDLPTLLAIRQNPELFLKFSLQEIQKQIAAASRPEPAPAKGPLQEDHP